MLKTFKVYKTWFQVVAILIVILIIATVLRVTNILSVPIFADEAIYLRWSQVMRAVPSLRFLPLSDGKQPLFMWLTIPFFKLISDPLIAGRTLSALCGLATCAAVFLITLRITKLKNIALISAFFYAVSPFSVFFDRMALVDSMLSMFGAYCLFFSIVTAQTLRLDTAMLTGFSLGAAYLTKSPAIFFFITIPLNISLVSSKKLKIIPILKLLSLWGFTYVIALGMYNILRLGDNFHLLKSRNLDYVFTIKEALSHPFDPTIIHLKEIWEWYFQLLPGTILLTALFGAFVLWKKSPAKSVLLLSWLLIPLLIESMFAKVFTARYILFSVPVIYVLAGSAFTNLKKKHLLWICISAITLPALYIDYLFITDIKKAPLPRKERSGYLEEWTSGTGIREVATFIKEEATRSGNKITVGTEGYFGTLPDGLQIYIADIPGVVVKGVGITISSVPESLINGKKAGDTVFLVVNSTRFKIENPETKGLTLIKSYPKAQKPDGTYESLMLWEIN